MRTRECDGINFGCTNALVKMRECGSVEGLGAECTPPEVARMSFTIIEARQ